MEKAKFDVFLGALRENDLAGYEEKTVTIDGVEMTVLAKTAAAPFVYGETQVVTMRFVSSESGYEVTLTMRWSEINGYYVSDEEGGKYTMIRDESRYKFYANTNYQYYLDENPLGAKYWTRVNTSGTIFIDTEIAATPTSSVVPSSSVAPSSSAVPSSSASPAAPTVYSVATTGDYPPAQMAAGTYMLTSGTAGQTDAVYTQNGGTYKLKYSTANGRWEITDAPPDPSFPEAIYFYSLSIIGDWTPYIDYYGGCTVTALN